MPIATSWSRSDWRPSLYRAERSKTLFTTAAISAARSFTVPKLVRISDVSRWERDVIEALPSGRPRPCGGRPSDGPRGAWLRAIQLVLDPGQTLDSQLGGGHLAKGRQHL